jgi:selenocysteine lyase/cysteine desulfurase
MNIADCRPDFNLIAARALDFRCTVFWMYAALHKTTSSFLENISDALVHYTANAHFSQHHPSQRAKKQ